MEDNENEQANQDQNNIENENMQDEMEGAVDTTVQVARKTKDVAQTTSQIASRAPGYAMKTGGVALEAAGHATKGTGKVMQVVGKGLQIAGDGMKKAGRATFNAGKATFDAGLALTGSVIGSIIGIPMMIAGVVGMGAGKALEGLGIVATKLGVLLAKLGKFIVKVGDKIIKAGIKQQNLGNKMLQAAHAKEPASSGSSIGGGSSEGDSDNRQKTGNIPNMPSKRKKKRTWEYWRNWRKWLIIGGVVVLIIIILVLLIRGSIKDDGTKKEGDKSNIPYVVQSEVLDKLVIVYDGTGNYTYAFQDKDGNYTDLDGAIDNAYDVLTENGCKSFSYLGDDKKDGKVFMKKMVQAEIATQYPDLTLNENLHLATPSSSSSGTSSEKWTSNNDYMLKTDEQGAIPSCTEDQLKEMIEKSGMSEEAKNNMRGVVSDLPKYEQQYKINAVFFMAVARGESTWGISTNAKKTHNWISRQHSDGTLYTYNSFSESTEDFFKLISESYYSEQRFTVMKIRDKYNNLAEQHWGEHISYYIEQFYNSIGVSITPYSEVGATVGGDDSTFVAGDSSASMASSTTGITGDIEITDKIDQNKTVKGGIKVKRKNADGTDTDLKYTSTENFNSLIKMKDKRATQYYTLVKTGGTIGSDGTNGGGVKLEGTTVSDQLWNFLINDMGYNEYVAAGIMGNAMNETGGNTLELNPTITNYIGCYGLFQWKPEYYPDVIGKDMSYQLNFFKNTWINEFNTYAKKYKSGFSYDQFKNMNDAGEAAKAFARIMERCESSAVAVRATNAENAYQTYHGKTSTNTQQNNENLDSSNSGTDSEEDSGTDSEEDSGSSSADANSSTSQGNGNFVQAATECHKYMRENGFTYNQSASDIPVTDRSAKITDCSHFVSWALYKLGYKCGRLNSGSLKSWASKNLETIYDNDSEGISTIDGLRKIDAQAGDIFVRDGHTQIFDGYTQDGHAIWLNCGSIESIQTEEGTDIGDKFEPFTQVYRPAGSGTSIAQSLDNFLFIGDSRYDGAMEGKLKSLGENITAIGVTSSTPNDWINTVKNGNGKVHGENVTLPSSANGVCVMLGVNGVGGSNQISDMEKLLNELHSKYQDNPIVVSSVYHVGTKYTYNDYKTVNKNIDEFNQAMQDFCGKNSWAHYIDITDGLDDSNNELKSDISGDGLHANENGMDIIVDNTKKKILDGGIIKTSSQNSGIPGYSIVVADSVDTYTTVTDSYTYLNSTRVEKSNGHTSKGKLSTATPAAQVISTSSNVDYLSRQAPYQAALQKYTLYYDFLWAVLVDSNSTDLIDKWASLVTDKMKNGDIVTITVYTDENVSKSSSTEEKGTKTRSNDNNDGTVTIDTYVINETTNQTVTTLQSKPCVTYADTWLVRYENQAKDYNEYTAKTVEKTVEKIDDESDKTEDSNDSGTESESTSNEDDDNENETNIIKILKKKENLVESLRREEDLVDEMIKDNSKVSFMKDIYKYVLDIANGEKVSEDKNIFTNNLLSASTFDLLNTSVVVGNTGSANYDEGITEGTNFSSYHNSNGDGVMMVYTANGHSYKVFCQGSGYYRTDYVPSIKDNIEGSGCSICSVSMILTGYGVNVTPREVGQTYHMSIADSLKEHGVNCHKVSNNLKDEIVKNLQAGKPVVIHVQKRIPVGNKRI